MSPERAAAKAAEALDQAAEYAQIPDVAGAYVGIADGWRRLYSALSGVPTFEPAEPAEIAGLPAEVRQLVHAVDQMRDHWAEADEARRRELWQAVHTASDAVWAREGV